MLFVGFSTFAQQYVDLMRFALSQTSDLGIKNSVVDETAAIFYLETSAMVPLPVNDNFAILAGLDYTRDDFRTSVFSANTVYHSTTLRLGASITHNDKWSGTYLLLPKLAGDYKGDANPFQMGGYFLWTRTKHAQLKYRFGLYTTSEAFGPFFVPLIGIYYLSNSKKFELNATMPITLDANYKLTKSLAAGFNFRGFINSYVIGEGLTEPVYVERSRQNYAPYLQYGLLENSILLRASAAYTILDYALYSSSDKIDAGISAIPIGDDRTRFNAELDGGMIYKLELVYRFHLKE